MRIVRFVLALVSVAIGALLLSAGMLLERLKLPAGFLLVPGFILIIVGAGLADVTPQSENDHELAGL